MPPGQLLGAVQGIEAQFGRDRSKERSKGPRTLDIDILLFGNEIIDQPDLYVPHPGMTERAFVLVPLLELEPDIRIPGTDRTYASFMPSVSGQGIYLFGAPPL
mgnify:FL=1